jgi:thioredoxin 1
MAIAITQDNLDQEIIKSSKPVIIDVYAEWCGPCKQMTPIFDELEKELGQDYKFAKINVDESRELSIKYGVSSVPTFLFMKDGQVKGRETGYMTKDALKKKIEALLG